MVWVVLVLYSRLLRAVLRAVLIDLMQYHRVGGRHGLQVPELVFHWMLTTVCCACWMLPVPLLVHRTVLLSSQGRWNSWETGTNHCQHNMRCAVLSCFQSSAVGFSPCSRLGV